MDDAPPLQHRRIALGGVAIDVSARGARAASLVDFLLRYMASRSAPLSEETGEAPPLHYHLAFDDRGVATLCRDGALIYTGESRGAVAELLLGEIGRHLAAHARAGPMFHAAAVALDRERGVLLPGLIGAGKTTLAAWLLASQGLSYLTDELVLVPHDTLTMRGFSRPLNVKLGGWEALRRHRALAVADTDAEASGAILSYDGGRLIAPSALTSAPIRTTARLHLILFPHYAPDAEAEMEVRPLSKAQASLRLMACLVNARNLPDHGVAEVARLARRVPAYELRYAELDKLAGRLEPLFAQKSRV
ncbi:MAG: hypothetical protein GVY30_11695 [Chloroflexi bacterium]|jgi:shikimate kinase|nr:hypothetical protein [Chloroflexota bacterium]